ncbi:HAMP domain-containing protein [Candidatus Parcubacteria bacterium]|nr:HAMP domain-containing protein [Candidatus Parcubacteria bacterium]
MKMAVQEPSQVEIDETIGEIWRRDVLTIFSILLLFVAVLLLFLRRVIKPLKEITFACQEIRKGNLNVSIPAATGTEIGELAETFNETIKSLKNFNVYLNEARLRTEEEKNKTLDIINNFSDGLLVFDKKNNLSLINPRAKEFLNVETEEVANKDISELHRFGNFGKLVNILGEERKEVFREELVVHKNLVLEVSAIFILRNREKIGTLVSLHDITREKMIENMKTEFVSISAHQLRTPLSAIKWTLRMLLDGDLGAISEKQKEFLEKTYKSNERMITLINDLLNVTRIEEGRYVFKVFLFDIEEICQSIVNSFQEEAKQKDIKLVLKKPGEKLPRIKLDNEKISLAIQNLVENAIRYSPSNGEVTVSLRRANMSIELCVRDTGIGIPGDQLDRVFSKFFRGANVMRIDTEGTGLGLYIAKNIIEAHKGRIWFESKEGEGSTFCFKLPI